MNTKISKATFLMLPPILSKMSEQVLHYTIIDFNEVDMRIYLPEKVINHRGC